jgi:SAM-dependent methyltransferase
VGKIALLDRLRRSSKIHSDVAERLHRYIGSGRVLDIPVGKGENAEALLDAGFDVVGADLRPEKCARGELRVDRVDMTKRLPYPDGSFDAVLHSEGIEHLDNQVEVLSELARVVKPGGVLIVTTPNLLHLEGRLLTMLTGHAFMNRAMVVETVGYWGGPPESTSADGTYFGHVFLINAFQLRFYMIHAGLQIVEVDTTRYSWKSVLLAPILYPFVWLATRRILRNPRSRIPRPLQREMIQQILSPALLFGRKAIFVGRKPVPAEGSD